MDFMMPGVAIFDKGQGSKSKKIMIVAKLWL